MTQTKTHLYLSDCDCFDEQTKEKITLLRFYKTNKRRRLRKQQKGTNEKYRVYLSVDALMRKIDKER